jgi:hypothetical protein
MNPGADVHTTPAHAAQLLDRSRLTGVPRKRFRFRPPGLKPGTKVGTLGPYRGRLGLAWVLAPLVIAIIIVVAGAIALFR